MALTKWIGNAVPIADVWTITLGGVWLATETATITALGKSVVLTVGSLVTVEQVCTSLAEAFNSTTFTDTTASVAPLGGGQGIPEFAELVATSTATTVVLTARTNKYGKPMPTFTVAEGSASGTIGISHTTTGTGPNDWSNADNWDTGAVPINADDVVIDRPISILYGLAQSAVTLTSLTISARFDSTCQIGNLVRSTAGYEEWRATELAIGATTVAITTSSGMVKLNFGTVQTAVTVYATGTAVETGRTACQLRGTHAANVLNVLSTTSISSDSTSDVGWGSNAETATVATVRQESGTLTIGSAVTLTTVTKTGGTSHVHCAGTTLNHSGTTYLWSGAWTTITAAGGTIYDYSTSTYTTLTLNNNSVYDASRNPAAKTITNCSLNDTSVIIDTADRLTFTNAPAWRGRLTAAAS